MTEVDPYAMTGLFGVHSEKDGQPAMRGWARGEAAAKKLLAELQESDDPKEDEYWILEMNEAEVESHKAMGMLFEDA